MSPRTNTSAKLNETQLVLLSAASQRRTHQVLPHETMSEQAYGKAVRALLKKGLIEEATLVTPGRGRKALQGEAPYYVINEAGTAAIGVSEETADFVPEAPEAENVGAEPRRPTKRDQVIALLSRNEGASIDVLIAATGWLPHTTRAALTGLRQKGFVLDRSKGGDGRAVYRIVDQERDDTGVGRAA